jgi:class 3 adenylate cyclase
MNGADPAAERAFLFTDIEGSTRLWERYPSAMSAALRLHDALIEGAIAAHGGTIFKTIGDAVCASFAAPAQATLAAIDAQRAFAGAGWRQTGLPAPIRVRMAVHAGPVQEHDGDYAGPVLNRLSRLLAAGHGGQILIAGAVAARIRDALPPGVDLRDLGERRLRDVWGTEHIFHLLVEGLPSSFRPLRTLDPTAHNLPSMPTACIGRDAERARLRSLIPDSDVRLVTLLGPGGIGKTRLALQIATDLLDEFPSGAWFVDLTPVREAEQVPGAVMRSLGIREEPGRTAEESVLDWLAGREALLVLDNCEQVIEGAALLASRIVQRAPGVRIVATSRIPLQIRGEQRLPVEPLDLPAGDAETGLADIEDSSSVRLFLARAREVAPGFELDDRNAPHVAAICRQVDGIPLALELAAARITALGPEALRERG